MDEVIQAGWFRRWLPTVARSLLLLSMAAPVLGTFLINIPDNRSFLIEAKTGQIGLTFEKGPNQWRLPEAILCTPVAAPRLDAQDLCGAAFVPEGPAREWLIDWSAGDAVELFADADGGLTIAVPNATDLFPAGSRLIASPAVWENGGTLLFQALVTIGTDMAPGTRHYLWSGRWEAREAGASTYFIRSGTETIKSGELSAGTRVEILKDQDSALSYGHIARRSDDGPMNITLLSEFADTALSVRFYGVENAVLIRPDWVDVAISSPLVVALAAVFPLLASVGLVLFDMVRRKPQGATTNPKDFNAPRFVMRREIRRSYRRRR